VYYVEKFEIFCSGVNKFDRGDASITVMQDFFCDVFYDSNELKVLKTDLAYIHANLVSYRSL
jgi:hypothetical protein